MEFTLYVNKISIEESEKNPDKIAKIVLKGEKEDIEASLTLKVAIDVYQSVAADDLMITKIGNSISVKLEQKQTKLVEK